MGVPPTIAAEAAMARQTVALSMIKQNASADKAIASILDQAVQSAPVSSSRGTNVNIKA